jgi:hypothetical protein
MAKKRKQKASFSEEKEAKRLFFVLFEWRCPRRGRGLPARCGLS